MKLLALIPSENGEIRVEQEFDRAMMIQIFQAAADQCKIVDNNGLVLQWSRAGLGIMPLKGREIVTPNGFQVPLSVRRGNA